MFGMIHPGAGVKSWAFSSPRGAAHLTCYVGGFYLFGEGAFVPEETPHVLGMTNVSYAAHAFVVLGAAATDMVIRVAGTSILDTGERVENDSQDLYTGGGARDDYFETVKKWLGEVRFTLQGGGGVPVVCGLCKYWDNNNENFTLKGLEVTGLAGADDDEVQIELLHHRPSGWRYSTDVPVPPSGLAALQANHGVDFLLCDEEPFAWKRDNLDQAVAGHEHEGVLFSVTVGDDKSIATSNFSIAYES
jgi:hypothetical protein